MQTSRTPSHPRTSTPRSAVDAAVVPATSLEVALLFPTLFGILLLVLLLL